jgi:glycosyltransferase involved in cell wall biosynthesis
MNEEPLHIAVFMKSLQGGGAERVMLALASSFADQGCKVDLVLADTRGHLHGGIPENVSVHELVKKSPVHLISPFARLASKNWRELATIFRRKLPRIVKILPALEAYLKSAQPDAVLSTLPSANIVAAWAVQLAGVKLSLVLREANQFSRAVNDDYNFNGLLTRLAWQWYRTAHRIIAVSEGVREDLVKELQIPEDKVTTIHNAVDSARIKKLGQMQIKQENACLREGEPFILAVGRLEPQKDYRTLLEAYAFSRSNGLARLVILGEGTLKDDLRTFAEDLGISSDLLLPGYVDNPYAFMCRASVFVLSSAWEGCPNVLLEAIACGCNIISTDCQSGPRELLDGGKYGMLVPVGDSSALAAGIDSALAGNFITYDPDSVLSAYSMENVARRYLIELS